MRRISLSVLGVANVKPNALISRIPACLNPKSAPLAHNVVAITPSSASVRNIFKRGVRSPAGPHQSLFSASRALKASSVRAHHLPGGGMNLAPDGDVTSYRFGEVPVFANCLPRAPAIRLMVNVMDCHGDRKRAV